MTTVRTIRYENGCRHVYHQRQFEEAIFADAYADFMALAGYVVELEG